MSGSSMISGHLYTAAAADGQHKVIEPIPEKNKKDIFSDIKRVLALYFLKASQPAPGRTSGLGV